MSKDTDSIWTNEYVTIKGQWDSGAIGRIQELIREVGEAPMRASPTMMGPHALANFLFTCEELTPWKDRNWAYTRRCAELNDVAHVFDELLASRRRRARVIARRTRKLVRRKRRGRW